MIRVLITAILLTFVICSVYSSEPEPIGSAQMLADGTIVLDLVAKSDDHPRLIGDARIFYKPDDPEYKNVLDHLGGLKPGESKTVQPWKINNP